MVEAAHRGLRPVEIERQTGYTKERDAFYHGCRRDVIELAGSYAPGNSERHVNSQPRPTEPDGVARCHCRNGESGQQIANK
jgi:hypothetical protein